ncbi:hypothetical protein Tco_0027629, partial [Tanacetum coccineum]
GDDLNVPTLKSCLKASMIRNIDGIIKGKDGIPLKPRRRVQISDKEVDALESQNPKLDAVVDEVGYTKSIMGEKPSSKELVQRTSSFAYVVQKH